MSRFGSVEPFIVGLLAPLISDGTIGEARAVAANGILDQTNADPSVFICSHAPTRKSESNAAAHSMVEYIQQTEIIIRVRTEGISIGEGKEAAWEVFDSVNDAIQNQVITDAPAGTTYGPIIPGDPFEVANVNSGEYGIGFLVEHEIMWVK